MFSTMSALNPKRSSNSRTKSRPLPEVTRDPFKIDPQRSVEGELKGLILFLTHWVEASTMSIMLSKQHEYWR
jgi:hypothetical protein